MYIVSHFPFYQQRNLMKIYMAIATFMKSSRRQVPYRVQCWTKSIKSRLLPVQENVSQVYNLSSFLSHIVHIVCANNSQGALGFFQLHTWKAMINTNLFLFCFGFFFLLLPSRVLHIEAEPNCGECRFRFAQLIKVHNTVIPSCQCQL